MLKRDHRGSGCQGTELLGDGPGLDVSRFIPGRDSIHCQTAEDPYRTAWEAAAHLPIPDAINEVVRRCGIPFDQANLLVFCEVREAQPIEPLP